MEISELKNTISNQNSVEELKQNGGDGRNNRLTVEATQLEHLGFPGGTGAKNPIQGTQRRRFTPGLGRSPGEGNGNPLQDSCLENPMDRGAWWAM